MKKRTSARERDEEHNEGTREHELREYSDRDHDDIDYEMEMKYAAETFIDPRRIPPGMRYTWIRYKFCGEPDDANWATYMRKGWKPVPASRHPEKKNIDTFGRLHDMRDYLHHGDVICCERSVRECEKEEAHLDRINQERLDGISNQLSLNTPASIPSRSISETSRGHGKDLGGYKTF